MAYGAAGRWARIHDIYISVILKPFLGNRIECELTFPFPAPFPYSSFVSPSPLPVLPCRWGGKIASMIKQPIVLTIMRLIVPFISPLPRPVHLIRSSRPLVVRPLVSSHRSVISSPALAPFLSPPYRQAGRGGCLQPCLRIAAACPSFHLVSSREMPLDVVRCREMQGAWISSGVA